MSETHRVDLNADLGERPDAIDIDAELMRYVTSANIACGGHAGDEATIRRMIELTRSLDVTVGAHPSFPDRANFGRVAMNMGASELEHSLGDQLRLIVNIAAEFGVRVTHVKPHGALYHSAISNVAVADAIARTVRAVDPSMVVVAQYGSTTVEVYRRYALRIATEGFADRAYESGGGLRNRSLSGALLDPERAVQQALNIVLAGRVLSFDGAQLTIKPDTLCIHSDTPGATTIAKNIRSALEGAGVQVKRLTG
jgi:UPF0271 protein